MKLLIRVSILVALLAAFVTSCTQHETKEQAGNSGSANSSTLVLDLNDSNFDAEITNGVVLVDFWATWCGPCKIQAPIIEEVAKRMEGKARVAKVDVDKAPKIAKRFNVQAIPSLIVFKNGKQERDFVGITTADSLVLSINSVVNAK